MSEVVGPAPGAEVDPGPMLRVVKGDPTDEELAALVAVLATRGSNAEATPQPRVSGWTDRATLVGAPLHPGSGAWRSRARRH